MVEPNEPLAAIIERSISVDADLIFEVISFEALTNALRALTAEVAMLSVVVAVTAPSGRWISPEFAGFGARVAPEVAASNPWASRGLLRIAGRCRRRPRSR